MKIVDTFLFWNEFDILELRLAEHYDYVDEFVIVECDHTFTGKFKGHTLDQNRNRYAKWWDKVNYIKVSDPPNTGNPWDNEKWQRGQFSQGWKNLGKDDVIIVSDVDEIIRPSALEQIRNTNYDVYVLNMTLFYLRYNYVCLNYPWEKVRAFRGFRDHGETMRQMRTFPGKNVCTIEHAGWHFSWLGNDAEVTNKIKSFSHYEFNNSNFLGKLNVSKSIQNNQNHFDMPMSKVKLDEYFPKALLENLDKYSSLILPEDSKTMRDCFPGSY